MLQLFFGLIISVTQFGLCQSKVAAMAASANAANKPHKLQVSYDTTESDKGIPLWGIM